MEPSRPTAAAEAARPAPGAPLPPCPATPNCVSTEADPADAAHHLPALPLRLHAVDRTRWLRFADDVEARVDVDARLLHVRSASRLGRGDLGANRRRVTAWLRALAADWGVAWPPAR